MNIYTDITEQPIDTSFLYNWCTHPEAGAVVSFGGTTRNNFENKAVSTLEYESYITLALQTLDKIAQELIEKGALKVALVHRIGNVPVQETSVICVVSTDHRPEGFDLCRKAIDEIKEKLEVWKKEVYNDSYTWKENKEALH